MAQITVKDAAGTNTAVELPNANGRASAAASRPVVLSTEDLAALASQATTASILAKIIAAPATEGKQDAQIAAINRVGTRAYGAGARIASGATTVISSAIVATEVLLHATEKQYVLAVDGTGTPTVSAETGIPLEAGEKFHMRITSGQRIATIRATADGFLNIAPVVA